MYNYHLNISKGDVTIPPWLDREYEELDEAADALEEFIHAYDGKKYVEGQVLDPFDIEVDIFCSKI